MFKQLKYFQSVVRLNSFSEAAEQLPLWAVHRPRTHDARRRADPPHLLRILEKGER